MCRVTTTTLAAAVLAAASAAQQTAARLTPDPVSWRIPIHTAADDPVGGAYGTWAVGPGYKVSFHDGFVFYPYLGADYPENLPLRWRTDSITVGGEPVTDTSSAPRNFHSEWRYEYRYPGVTEAYDVLPDGVEQTFVVHERPGGRGDLVITGCVETALRAAPLADTHAALTFRDAEGRPLVEYGSATALDSAGHQAEMTTSFDGERVELRLDGAWLREATFPVTVDPVTTPLLLHRSPPGSSGDVLDSDATFPVSSTARDPNLALVVLSRKSAANDLDAWGIRSSADLKNPQAIWADVTVHWSTVRPRCSHVSSQPQDLWVIAFEERYVSGSSAVNVYVHQPRNLTLNSGSTHHLNRPSGYSHSRPDIGGTGSESGSPNYCLIVFQEELTHATTGTVRGVVFNPATGWFALPFHLAKASHALVNRRNPSVIKHGRAPWPTPWVVAWQEKVKIDPTDDWDVFVNRVWTDTTVGRESVVGPYAASDIDATTPLVSGDSGRYLVTYGRRKHGSSDFRIGYQRFDWKPASSAPTVMKERQISGGVAGRARLHGTAFDQNTESHWALVYEIGKSILARRLGFTGGTVESATVHRFPTGVGAGGVAHSRWKNSFLVTFANNGAYDPLYGCYFEFDPAARTGRFGRSCNPNAKLSGNGPPYAGHGDFQLICDTPVPFTTAFLLAAPSLAMQPIPGTNGCNLLLSPSTMFVVVGKSTGHVGTIFPIPLPDDPVFRSDVCFQVVYVAPGWNPLGIQTTNALLLQVR